MALEEQEYILGTDGGELERLRFQHQAWVKEGYALWEAAGIRAGDTVMDLGCGPGFTSFELAHLVGKTGKVIARDQSPRFLTFLEQEAQRRGHPQVETSLGPVENLNIPPGSLDAAYARWLFCWLPDPGAGMSQVARALKPGGALVIQDYLDWGGMKLMPASDIFDRTVLACMKSWADGGSYINIGEKIPVLAEASGLKLEYLQPRARVGRVGSLEWRWLEGFFHGYLPRLVERDLMTPGEFEAFKTDWAERSREETSHCYAPVVVDVILRKG